MTPQNICVSLETAKALKEAGWGKDTVFTYAKNDAGEMFPYLTVMQEGGRCRLPAPTVGELLDALKPSYNGWELTITYSDEPINVEYLDMHKYSRIDDWGPLLKSLASLWINHPEIRK